MPTVPAAGAARRAGHAALVALALAGAGAAWSAGPPPSLPDVHHVEGAWTLDPRGSDTAALVLALAHASGSELHASPVALAQLRPLRHAVQGARLADAWQAVLATSASHALQCSRSRCRVWILAPAKVPPAASVARKTDRMADPFAHAGMSGVTDPPGSSVALEPDPPGLFPSE